LADRFTRPEAEIGLAEAALLVSRLDNPELDVAAYLAQLDRMAAEIQASLKDGDDPPQRLAALNRYLFAENGFHGSRTQYYQAANSYFDRLLDDREGLPITLGVLYLELATRLGLKAEGVGLPGHFVVRILPPQGEAQLIDVFDAGKTLSLADARRLSIETSGVALDDSYLVALDKRAIVLRVLRNLQGIAQRQQDPEALLRYLEATVSLAPDEPSYRGMRAVVRHETGRKAAAVADLDWFLEKTPDGIDLDAIRELKQRFNDGQ
jgi:regulator of sirC expression with transglutaminase-like and TPR domain